MTDTKQQVVDDGVAIFNSIENTTTGVPAMQAAVLSLKDIIDRGIALSMAPGLQGTALKAKIDSINGKLSGAMSDVLDFHNTLTKIAQSNGVDPPVPNGGGTRPTY